MYGNAPWMGTLRHVTHENKVVQSYKSPQFKKYPDEDAPNPFQVNTKQKNCKCRHVLDAIMVESVDSPVSNLGTTIVLSLDNVIEPTEYKMAYH